MTSFWELTLRLGTAFVQLPMRTKIMITGAFLLTFATLWLGAFGLRVWSSHYALEADYLESMDVVIECNRTKSERRWCLEARRNTTHSLFTKAVHDAWNKTYLCGGSPCIDIVFGTDSTFMGVVFRAALVGLTFTVVIVLVAFLKKSLVAIDRYFKNNATSQYSAYEKLPLPPLAASVYDASGIFEQPPKRSHKNSHRRNIVDVTNETVGS
jgi:hypothetical protein